MKKRNLLMVCALVFGLSAQVVAQNIQQIIDQQIVQLLENNKISTQDTNWVITNQHTSSASGVQHIYYRQTLNGIEIYGTESSVHLFPNGEVLKADSGFIANAQSKATGGANPSFTAVQAVQSAATYFNYNNTGDISIINLKNNVAQETILSKGSISLSDIPARLVYQMNQKGELVLAWDLSIEEVAQLNWWSVRVDAASGAIVDQVNWMSNCNFAHDHSIHETLDYHKNLYDIPNYNEAIAKKSALLAAGFVVDSYEVFAIPVESPYFGARTIEVTPADATASPFGWHDTDGVSGAEFTVTRGNNTNSYEDGDNPGYQPDGGGTLEFTGYPFSQIYSAGTQYEDAAITNLFYWNNIIHDVLYIYGFDEVAGNFQENNYGNGGAGSDSVNAEAQDGSGTCNANFGTPADGSNPRMQMYICGDKDGDFDNLVIIHEYGHGISNRLTGGPNNTGCLGNQEQMGEGWSDWYGVVMTIEPGDTGTDGRAVGTYLFGQGAGGAGIRPFPYNTDIAANPQTYDDIKTAAVPHGVGSVWATMLWEVTWALIDDHGWDPDIYNFTGDVNQDAGNVMAMALVTEGMKLQPCSPGFVDGRDAIFAADLAIYGGANECSLWDAFAKRGLGVNADQGSSGSRSDGTENFETPSGTAAFTAPGDVCANDPELTGLGGGTPSGGVYSGTGVTDDGNGATYSFDPVVAGIGVHTITYDVPNGPCSTASSASDTIEVLAIPASPTATGVSDFCVGDTVTVTAVPADGANIIRWFDAETGGNLLGTGTSYSFMPPGTTSVWAEETPPGPASQLKISEITLQADKLEIQNVGLAADYTGYSVAVSDQPYSNINAVNSVVQTLSAMGPDSARFWDEVGGSSQEWGVNIFWNDGSPGWILIIDDTGNVVDTVFWNTSAAEIGTFNVTINGFNVTAADLDWVGIGADFGSTCNESYRRNDDSDDATNWAGGCLTSDYGVPNADINLGYQGCIGDRAEAVVTADALPPTISCPANVTVNTDAGQCTASGVGLGSPTTTDNCAGETTSNDAPGNFPLGDTTVTWTVTDTAGNTATCTQIVTVVDNEDPTLTCPADLTVEVNEGELFTLPDYTGDAVATDNCTTSPSLTQDPAAGTDVGVGTTVITITAEDDSGNTVSCTFTVTVNLILGLDDNALSTQIILFPNPTQGILTLVNNSNEVLTSITITDVNGRTIETIDLQNAGTNTNFSIEPLAQGMYFVRIDTESSMTVKQIVKQ
jgi:extracellular elastinolytic metalloproteinase